MSHASQTEVFVSNFYYDEDLNVTITRSQFEDMCAPFWKRCVEKIQEALKGANLKKQDIAYTICVGGSTYIPKVRTLLREYARGHVITLTEHRFFGKESRKDINAEEAVATGAAYKAAVEVIPAHQLKGTALGNAKLKDVCPLNLGIRTEAPESRDFCVLIPKNSGLPTQIRKVFRTAYDNQCSFEFHIYQGEHVSQCKENVRIAEFTLADLPQRPAGQVSAAVTFCMDENAMLSVNAVCTDDSRLSAGITVGEDFTRVRATSTRAFST